MQILMLGNSLTSSNRLPSLLASLTGAEVTAHTRGGARLAEHLNPATRLGARTQQALAERHWDFVILQEMSNGPVTAPEAFLRSVTRLSDLIRSHGAVPLLYGTWAYREGHPKLASLGLTREEMALRMSEGAREAARESCALLCDVGEAFFLHPNPDALYAPDGVHPSAIGTRLAAEALAKAVLSVSGEAV